MLKEFLQTNVYLPVDKYIRDQSKKPAIRNGSQRGLRMPPVVGLILLGGLVLFALGSVTAFYLDPRPFSRMAVLLPVFRIFFPAVCLLCLICLISLPLYAVDWDEHAISGPNLLGIRTRLPWQDIADCTYDPAMRSLKVISKDGAVIWAPDYFLGFNELCEYIKERFPDCTCARSSNIPE